MKISTSYYLDENLQMNSDGMSEGMMFLTICGVDILSTKYVSLANKDKTRD